MAGRFHDRERSVIRLPPRRLALGTEGLREDLIDLGVLQPMPEGRIDIPDVYRVGLGLGRRGGVRPVE